MTANGKFSFSWFYEVKELWLLNKYWSFLNQKGKWKKKFFSHKYLHRKTPVIVSFSLQLQAWGLFTKKGLHLICFFAKFVKFYRISFLQKAAGRLFLISHNISDMSLALLATNQLSYSWLSVQDLSFRKQFTVFDSKIFKITKVEGNISFGWGRRRKFFSRKRSKAWFSDPKPVKLFRWKI